MKMEKKETTGGDGRIAYARKESYEWDGQKFEADLQNGDKVTIKSEAKWTEGNYGPQCEGIVTTRNGEKKANFNQSSINTLIGAYGDDSKDWVGKEVNVITKKGVFAGKKGIALYLVPDGWSLDDYGDLVNDNQDVPVGLSPKQAKEIKQARERGIKAQENADEISPHDIPF